MSRLPVSKSDHSSLIVNVVAAAMRIVRVIDHHSSAQSVAILGYWKNVQLG